jgi:hypothetical protein
MAEPPAPPALAALAEPPALVMLVVLVVTRPPAPGILPPRAGEAGTAHVAAAAGRTTRCRCRASVSGV